MTRRKPASKMTAMASEVSVSAMTVPCACASTEGLAPSSGSMGIVFLCSSVLLTAMPPSLLETERLLERPLGRHAVLAVLLEARPGRQGSALLLRATRLLLRGDEHDHAPEHGRLAVAL